MDGGVLPWEAFEDAASSDVVYKFPNWLVDEIKRFEGYRPRAYWDYKQYSVGYGTRAAGPHDVVDSEEADRRLRAELEKSANIVDSFKSDLPEGVRSALISLTFNAGPSWTEKELGRRIREGDYEGAKERFLLYSKAGGVELPALVRRRLREASWFDTGGSAEETPPPTIPSPPPGGGGAALSPQLRRAEASMKSPPSEAAAAGAQSGEFDLGRVTPWGRIPETKPWEVFAEREDEEEIVPWKVFSDVEEEKPVEKKVSEAPSAISRGFWNSFLEQNPTVFAESLEGIADLTGFEFPRNVAQRLREYASRSPEEYKLQAKGLFEAYNESWSALWTKLGELFGSSMGSTVVPAAAGLGGAAVGGAAAGPVGAAVGIGVGAGSTSFLMNMGEVRKALIDEGLDPKTASKWAVSVAPVMAALDVIPISKTLGTALGINDVRREVARSIARRLMAESAKGAAREGITEAAQEVVKMATESLAAGKKFWSTDNIEPIVESLLGGAMVGGTFGMAAGIRRDKIHGEELPPGDAGTSGTSDVGGPVLPQLPGPKAVVPGEIRLAAEEEARDPFFELPMRLMRVIDEKVPRVADPKQINATIQNAGVSDEEINLSGFREVLAEMELAGEKRIQKNDLIEKILERSVNLKEVIDPSGSQEYAVITFPTPRRLGGYVNLVYTFSPPKGYSKELGFVSEHWPPEVKDIVSHVRGEQFEFESGAKGFFAFEIQSDWDAQWRDGKTTAEFPFKNTWPEITLRKTLQYAARSGYNFVAFPANSETAGFVNFGMKEIKQFYDHRLPKAIKAVAREYGAQVVEDYAIAQSKASGRYIGRGKVYRVNVTRRMLKDQIPFVNAEIAKSVLQGKKAFFVKTPIMKEVRISTWALETFEKILSDFAKKFKIDAPIAIMISERMPPNTKALVRSYVNSKNKYALFVIHLNRSFVGKLEDVYGNQINAMGEVISSLGHEFGHIIDRVLWEKAPPHVKQARIEGYKQYRKNIERNFVSGVTSITPPIDIVSHAESRLRVIPREYLPDYRETVLRFLTDVSTGIDQENIEYILKESEWWASQVAKWFTTREKPLSVIEKYAKNEAEWLRTMRDFVRLSLEKLGVKVPLDPAEKFISDWLDSYVENNANPAEAETLITTREAHEFETAEENARALENMNLDVEATSFSGATLTLRASEELRSIFGNLWGNARAQMALADRFNKFYEWTISTIQLGLLNPDIAPLQKYNELWELRQRDVMGIMDAAHTVVKKWMRFNWRQRDAIAGLLDDYMNMVYLPQGAQPRLPTQQELLQLARRNGVTREGLDLFNEIVHSFEAFLRLYTGLRLFEASKIPDPAQRAAAQTAVLDEYTRMSSTPYVPAMRFGDYTLVVRDPNGRVEHFETFESMRTRRAAEREIRRVLPPGRTIELGVLHKQARPFLGMPPGLIDLIAQKLNLSAAQRAQLEELRFELSPTQSFKHRFRRKKRTPGYSMDFMRAYANYFFHGANFFANVRYVDEMRNAIRDVRYSARGYADQTKRQMIANFLENHLEYGLSPKKDFAAVSQFAFLWYLGFSPASATLNLTQMLLTSYPLLGAEFGDMKAAKALMTESARISNFYKKGTVESLAHTNWRMRALNEAIRQGFINAAFAPELAAISEGRDLGIGFGSGRAQRMWHKFNEMGAFMFGLSEQMLRRVTFMATLELARVQQDAPFIDAAVKRHALQYQSLRNAGWTVQEARAFIAAKEAVQRTQFVMERYAHPKFMRGLARPIFVFKLFLQNMLFFLIKESPPVKLRAWLTLAFLGGIMGLPFADELKELIRGLSRIAFGKDFNIEAEVREFVADVVGEKSGVMSDILLHGMARRGMGIPLLMNSLGVPYPTVDRSKAVGLGNPFQTEIREFLTPERRDDARSAIAQTLQSAVGAGYGTAFNLYYALTDSALDWNDFKRWERAMPRAAANLSKAWRAYSEGRERDRSGATVLRFDVTDSQHMSEIIAMALGYTPLRLSTKWDVIALQRELETYYDVTRQRLMRRYHQAQGDEEQLEKVRNEILDFNKSLPEYARAKEITSDQLRRSVRERERDIMHKEAGVPRERSSVPIAEYVQKLYPNAEVDVRPTK